MTNDLETDYRLGATPLGPDASWFLVWAPSRESVAVESLGAERPQLFELERQQGGYFAGRAPLGHGALYQYRLDGQVSRPDPASRRQPQGVHGPSEVVGFDHFTWSDSQWRGVQKRDLIIYELHVGVFTADGTLAAAIERIPQLVSLGVTAVELMPVTQSPGQRNWGYDGVNLFAVRDTYGHPDDLRAFVDACHDQGLAVLLDVVYNHVGPEGNYLGDFGPYSSSKQQTPWGDAFNFDGRRRGPVRRFVIENVLYWLEEYHLDGLRLDAAHFMHDESSPDIHQEILAAARGYEERSERTIHMIAETNVYDHRMATPLDGALAYDALWSDCLMHSLYSHALPEVHLTGRSYQGASDIAGALRHGYLFYGDQYRRASAADRDAFHADDPAQEYLSSLVMALQTHDSVGNHPSGSRVHQLASKSLQKAAAALWLLYPSIPLIFMGEESAVDAPFPFFVDFEDRGLRRAVNKGRAREYPHHARIGAPLPSREATFLQAKCSEPDIQDPAVFEWYQRLLTLRKEGVEAGWLAPSCLTSEWDPETDLFSLTYSRGEGRQVTVLARLASDPQAGPVLATAGGELLLSSEPILDAPAGQVRMQGQHAVVVGR